MSFLRRLRNQAEHVTRFDNYTTLPSFFAKPGTVDRDRAMRITTVWACVKLRAQTIGALPVGVIEHQGRTRIPQEAPAWLERPNPEMTSFELMERTSASIDVDGNSYWYLDRDRLGRVGEVWVLPPSKVTPYRDTVNGKPGPKRFTVEGEDYGPDEILQIAGFTLPGRLRGMNPIEEHAHALGLAVAAEEFGEAYFQNGSVMSGVIEHPGNPGRERAKEMRDSFARDHSGRKAHKPGLLYGGAKWTQLSIPNDSAQFIETRKYQRSEIAAIFGVPPHKIGDLERATFSNIEHQAIEWVTDGLLPPTRRIEAAVLAAGILPRGQHLRFNLNGQLRGDIASRYLAYAIGRQWGWLNADDICELEDRNPLPGGIGQTYLEPLNMVPAGERATVPPEMAKALLAAGVSPELVSIATGQTVHVQEDR